MDLKISDIIQQCIDEKWMPIMNLEINDEGMGDCALCTKFLNPLFDNPCVMCPLYKRGQICGDENSVYSDFSEVSANNLRSSLAYKKAAEQMILMLEKVKNFYISKGD